MNRTQPKDLAASIKQRLLNLSKERREDPNRVFVRYAAERLLYRLSRSEYADRFALKGAMLFPLWIGIPHRSTKDIDLLGYGDTSPESLKNIFEVVCGVDVQPDGLVFDGQTIDIIEIREEHDYTGQRVTLTAWMGRAPLKVQIDVGVGDAVSPSPREADYPTLLEGIPSPRIWAYSKEAVIAEKFEAMVTLGIRNSRMKDFYDIATMAECFEFNGATLVEAIRATFGRRGIAIPSDPPLAFTEEFASDPMKQRQWQGFLNRTALRESCNWSLGDAVQRVAKFLVEPLASVNATPPLQKRWNPGGPWA